MPDNHSADKSLTALLNESHRPIYAIDVNRRIAYCNPALEKWLELASQRIVGRFVEYHSEFSDDAASPRDAAGPLTGLCPPPRALAGEPCHGTVSCLVQDGRLVHRRADFVPLNNDQRLPELPADHQAVQSQGGVLVLLATADLSPQKLTTELSAESTPDDLHRVIRQFRRVQSGRYAVESLLGRSSAMQKVRDQVAFASTSGANTLICGRSGTGRAHIARAIHYHAAADTSAKLVPLDGETTTDESLRRAIDSLAGATPHARRPTLLIERIDRLSASQQSQLVEAFRRGRIAARLLATTDDQAKPADAGADADDEPPRELDSALRDVVSTVAIHVPRLAERMEDLPLLAQFFLESANRGSAKQVGSLRPESLDLLALYSWPGELDELHEVIVAAHRAAMSPAIRPADLPAVVHHAANAAAMPHRPREQIVLDELLATIEKEAIVRALAQAKGNKSEAAELLGLTRPRLYRRMQQLGLIAAAPRVEKPADDISLQPDFREIGPEELPS